MDGFVAGLIRLTEHNGGQAASRDTQGQARSAQSGAIFALRTLSTRQSSFCPDKANLSSGGFQ